MPMPKLVPTMKTGVLSKWLVEVGQEVQVTAFEFVNWFLCNLNPSAGWGPRMRVRGGETH